MIFRADLVRYILPFPKSSCPFKVHDHWIALVAGLHGKTLVCDEIVQDYIQHQSNTLGELVKKGRLRRILDFRYDVFLHWRFSMLTRLLGIQR
jgi:hypothetical protein